MVIRYKKIALNQVLQIMTIVLSGALSLYIYNHVGPKSFGLYSAMTAIAAYSFVFDPAFIVQGYQIDFRKSRSADLFSTTFILVLISSFFVLLLTFILAYFGSVQSKDVCIIYAIVFSLNPTIGFFRNHLVITQRIYLSFIVSLLSKLSAFGGLLYINSIYDLDGVNFVLYFYALDQIIASILLAAFVLGKQRIGKFSLGYCKSLLKYALPLISSNLGTGFLFRSVRVVFSKYLSPDDFGKLTMVNRVMDYFKGPGSLIIKQRYPLIIDEVNDKGIMKTTIHEVKLFSRIALGIFILISISIPVAEKLLARFPIQSIVEIKIYLYAVAYFTIVRLFTGLLSTIVIAGRFAKVQAVSMWVSTMSQLLLAYVGVKYFGIIGAIIAVCINSIIAQVILCLAMIVYKKIMKNNGEESG